GHRRLRAVATVLGTEAAAGVVQDAELHAAAEVPGAHRVGSPQQLRQLVVGRAEHYAPLVYLERRARQRTLREPTICPGQCERPAGLHQGLQHRSALPSGPVDVWQEARTALTRPRKQVEYAYVRH